ncbi:MAG: sugar phosphate isomerase/epimerase family protein [Thermoguttaceae bacterium]|nr:sugar phosphate isomerase/epimerase family protein [Thermoguttaceae bacterium]
MLRCTAGAAAATFISGFEPLLAAPAARWFKIGACDWNLGRRGNPDSFLVAKEIGLDGVQISMGVLGGANTTDPEVRRQYREATEKTGLEIASLAIGEMNQVPLKSDPQAAEWLAQSIGVCKDLGLDIVMPACFAKGDLDMSNTAEIDHLVGVLRDVAPSAEKAGVVIGLENYLSAADNLKLIDRVGSPALSVYYDVGNSTDKGYDILAEIRELGRKGLICQFHAKDGGHRLGGGRIDFRKVREAIDDIGYNGWIVIEAAAPNGLLTDYSHYARFLRGVFPEKGKS